MVVRRDNIGGPVCALLVFEGTCRCNLDAHIGALVNFYNAPCSKGTLMLIACTFTPSPNTGLTCGQPSTLLARLAGVSGQIVDQDADRPLHGVERVYGIALCLGHPWPASRALFCVGPASHYRHPQGLGQSGYG